MSIGDLDLPKNDLDCRSPANDAGPRGRASDPRRRRSTSRTALVVAGVSPASLAPRGSSTDDRPSGCKVSDERTSGCPEELEAEAHALFARAHELLARAARARQRTPSAGAFVRVSEAARIAATSARVIREAIRRGELVAYGRQRDRAVRADDLARWIETRRLGFAGPADADIERRVRRLSGQGKRSAA